MFGFSVPIRMTHFFSIIMIQIDDVVVSLDVFREKFLCDLGACKGECCIEGDAGAPVEMDEVAKLEEVLPVIWDDLAPEAQAIIDKQGVVYTDEEGDLVTSIVNGKDCVFTCYDEKGSCFCAIEKAYRAGKVDFCKPVSCALCAILRKAVWVSGSKRITNTLPQSRLCRFWKRSDVRTWGLSGISRTRLKMASVCLKLGKICAIK